jgi:hypothetical protein
MLYSFGMIYHGVAIVFSFRCLHSSVHFNLLNLTWEHAN